MAINTIMNVNKSFMVASKVEYGESVNSRQLDWRNYIPAAAIRSAALNRSFSRGMMFHSSFRLEA